MDSLSFEHFSIYLDNLSPYYIVCILLSFVAVVLTWWYLEHDTPTSNSDDSDSEQNDGHHIPEGSSFMTEMKVARQRAFDQELTKGMSDEQLQQEKDAEKEQLAAIFDLLREQKDKFQIDSVEDLQSQMKLYRR